MDTRKICAMLTAFSLCISGTGVFSAYAEDTATAIDEISEVEIDGSTENSSDEEKETDIYGWLPDCSSEFSDFRKNNEAVSLHNGYIAYCDDVAHYDGLMLDVEIQNESLVKQTAKYEVNYRSLMPLPPANGNGVRTVIVYEPAEKGKVKFEFKKYCYWNKDKLESDIEKYYSIDEDMTVTEISESDYNEQNALPEFVPGDANGDGAFTSADIAAFQRWLLNIGEIANTKAIDMNKDEKINIIDLNLMKNEFLKACQ